MKRLYRCDCCFRACVLAQICCSSFRLSKYIIPPLNFTLSILRSYIAKQFGSERDSQTLPNLDCLFSFQRKRPYITQVAMFSATILSCKSSLDYADYESRQSFTGESFLRGKKSIKVQRHFYTNKQKFNFMPFKREGDEISS